MGARTIPTSEYVDRVARARAAAHERGLEALLAWSAGGGLLDRHAQLLYLADFYPAFPTIPDLAGAWSDRGHAALLIGADDSLLLADQPVSLDADAVADATVETRDLVGSVAAALRERGLAGARVGLVEGRALGRAPHERLRELCPDLALEPADDLVLELRLVKSAAELELLRRAARLGRDAVERVVLRAEPGVSEAELVASAIAEVSGAGGVVANAFGSAFAPARSEARVRLPPFSRSGVLDGSEVYSLDLSGVLDDYLFDVCRSRAVSGTPSAAQSRVLELSRAAVDSVVAAIRPGATAAEASRAGFEMLEREGYDRSGDEFEALGHGLGLGFEPPFLHPSDGTTLAPGMVLAVEKLCWEGGHASAFERTVVVTDGGVEDLAELVRWSNQVPAGGARDDQGRSDH